MNVADEAAKILTQAIDLLRTHGWTQGHNVDEAGRMCTIGAICVSTTRICNRAANRYPALATAIRAVVTELGTELGTEYIADWNDHPERTVEDVITLLEHAIKRAKDAKGE